MGILASLQGWKSVSGLVSLFLALLMKSGYIGDGSDVARIAEMLMWAFGGTMTPIGLIDKIKRQAAEKAASIVAEKLKNDKVLHMMDNLMDRTKDVLSMPKEMPPEEMIKLRAKARETDRMHGFGACLADNGFDVDKDIVNAARTKSQAQMTGYTPRQTRNRRDPDMVNAAMRQAPEKTEIDTETKEDVTN